MQSPEQHLDQLINMFFALDNKINTEDGDMFAHILQFTTYYCQIRSLKSHCCDGLIVLEAIEQGCQCQVCKGAAFQKLGSSKPALTHISSNKLEKPD